jgi:hypothetical protein
MSAELAIALSDVVREALLRGTSRDDIGLELEVRVVDYLSNPRLLLYTATLGEYPPDFKIIGPADPGTLAETAWARARGHLSVDDPGAQKQEFVEHLKSGKPFHEGAIYAEIVNVTSIHPHISKL